MSRPTQQEALSRLRDAIRLTSCPNCDGDGWIITETFGHRLTSETCRIPECGGGGLVTIAERDAILARPDGLQHRSRP